MILCVLVYCVLSAAYGVINDNEWHWQWIYWQYKKLHGEFIGTNYLVRAGVLLCDILYVYCNVGPNSVTVVKRVFAGRYSVWPEIM